MGLTKEEIRERLKTESVWVTTSWTALLAAVADRKIRYIVAIWISGNRQSADDIEFALLPQDGTVPTNLSTKWSPIPVGPADFRQIPEGNVDIEGSILTCEGGSRLYGRVVGISLNTTTEYWDDDI